MIFKKSPAGGPDAEKIFMEFYHVPEELHWKILEYQEKGNQDMTTAHLTTVMVTTSY